MRWVGEKPPHKYYARPLETPAGRFDSKGELKRWQELSALESAGHIHDLRRQVRFKLTAGGQPLLFESGRQAVYVADFVYTEADAEIIEDFKGFDPPQSRLKRAIMRAMGHHVRVVK